MKKTNFITAFALAAALLFSACNKTESGDTDVNNDQNQTEVEDSDYTYDETTNTYTVYTATGLLAWNEAAQIDTTLNCTLAADIDLTDIDWTSTEWLQLGYYNDEFDYKAYTGTFEGNDYTITGLTIDQEETSSIGLIGRLGSDGKVQNLTLKDVNITGHTYVGGVVGWNNSGTVINCSVSGSISGNMSVSGVVGINYGTVTACNTSCSVSSSISYSSTGGVVGYNSSGTVTACYHTSGSLSGAYVGGVVGYNSSGSTVTACYTASGSLSGSLYVGGIVGRNEVRTTVNACYWSGDDNDGIGLDSGSGSATKVDGTIITWSDAVDGMNEALETNQSDWRYELLEGNDYPTLTKISSE